MIQNWLVIVLPFLVALLSVGWIHPKLVKIALMKDIVDTPNARKLQRVPVPILGGVAVFFGIILGIGSAYSTGACDTLFIVLAALVLMLYIGTMDDILCLSPWIRLVVEIFAVGTLIFVGGYKIDNLHGLWGIYLIPAWLAVPMTIFAAVGIINAINLIDGVDGLSSGFCVMASVMLGTAFALSGNLGMTVLAAASAGALIPFFLHNVFGRTSKMFIGDGGTLVMGIIMSVFVIRMLRDGSIVVSAFSDSIGWVPFTLAVLSVPVFDTLRVMTARILRHQSPFHPDKTHLHHMFIEVGFSHAGVTLSILSLNTLIVLAWAAMYYAGASIEWQFYGVMALGIAVTFGLYYFVKAQQARNTRMYMTLRKIGIGSHIERKGIFLKMQNLVDKI